MEYKFVQGTCFTKKCPNSKRKKTKFCKSCAAWDYRTSRRDPTWAYMRQDTLEKWQNRLIEYGTNKNKEFANVARHVRRRKAR